MKDSSDARRGNLCKRSEDDKVSLYADNNNKLASQRDNTEKVDIKLPHTHQIIKKEMVIQVTVNHSSGNTEIQ